MQSTHYTVHGLLRLILHTPVKWRHVVQHPGWWILEHTTINTCTHTLLKNIVKRTDSILLGLLVFRNIVLLNLQWILVTCPFVLTCRFSECVWACADNDYCLSILVSLNNFLNYRFPDVNCLTERKVDNYIHTLYLNNASLLQISRYFCIFHANY